MARAISRWQCVEPVANLFFTGDFVVNSDVGQVPKRQKPGIIANDGIHNQKLLVGWL
jgi:hypothetical protein